jgi:hypothetical protein
MENIRHNKFFPPDDDSQYLEGSPPWIDASLAGQMDIL